MKQNKALSRERAVVLGALREGPACGSQVIHRLEDQSENPFRGREGMLYPALHGLERGNFVTAKYWFAGNPVQRRYYWLTRKGRRLLAQDSGEDPTPQEGGARRAESPTDLDDASALAAVYTRTEPVSNFGYTSETEKTAAAPYHHWADRAVRPLIFPPCRRRVRSELDEHFDDRIQELRQRNTRYGEAEARLVAGLGSPEETARALREVHKPWLDWCLRVARLFLLLLVIGLLVAFLDDSSIFSNLRIASPDRLGETYGYSFPIEGRGDYVIAAQAWSCEDEVQVGSFRFRCENVYFCTANLAETTENGASFYRTYSQKSVMLRCTAAPWHSLSYRSSLYYIVDDQGTEYYRDTNDYWHLMNVRFFRVNPFQSILLLLLPDDDRHPEWLEVHFGRDEAEQTLRIGLEPLELRPENLPVLEDEAAAILDYVEDHTINGNASYAHSKPYRDSYSMREVGTGSGTVDVPWAALTRYSSQDHAMMECVLEFKGDIRTFPFSEEELRSRLRITALGTEGPDVLYWFTDDRDWYDTVCFLHLTWYPVEGAAGYDLHYTAEEGGPVCTLRLEPGEEAAK